MPSSYYSKLVRHRVASWTSLACAAWRYTVRTPNGLIHTYTTFSFTRAGSVYFALGDRGPCVPGYAGFAVTEVTESDRIHDTDVLCTVQESTGTMFRLNRHTAASCGDWCSRARPIHFENGDRHA